VAEALDLRVQVLGFEGVFVLHFDVEELVEFEAEGKPGLEELSQPFVQFGRKVGSGSYENISRTWTGRRVKCRQRFSRAQISVSCRRGPSSGGGAGDACPP